MKAPVEIKAVEMVRRIRDKHYELLKDATPEERIAFYRQAAERAAEQREKEAEIRRAG
jgi:hypothetical protein